MSDLEVWDLIGVGFGAADQWNKHRSKPGHEGTTQPGAAVELSKAVESFGILPGSRIIPL